jgi:hypothetical protein
VICCHNHHCLYLITCFGFISCLELYFEIDVSLFFFKLQKWAVDLNKHACESLRLNHPETQVVLFIFNFDFLLLLHPIQDVEL